MRSKILIIVFFLNTSVFSQNFFSIQLLSKRDSTAIPYAFMRVLSNYQLLQADSLGVFNFSLKTIQEEVILSSVGFYSKKLVVIPDITKIYLDEKTEELNEIDILFEKKNEFFNSDSLDVIDLEIRNGFWILAQNTAKPIRKYIFYLDYNQQLVAKQNVNKSFLKLESLCNDELFVGNKDSLYQVNYLSDKIVLNFPVANNLFDDLNRNCVINDKNRIVKVKYEFLQLRSLFVLRTKYADSINEKIIFKVEDSLTTHQLREQYVCIQTKVDF